MRSLERIGSMDLHDVIAELGRFKAANPRADKEAVRAHIDGLRTLTKNGSVYVGRDFAIRVSEANTGSFSNVVLSLSTLRKYDAMPVVICIVRPNRMDFRLANTTFLRKISHSSLALRIDNVKGSFLGHDIMDEYEGIPNRSENFDQLVAMHAEFTWVDNLERLVGTTSAIAATKAKLELDETAVAAIMGSPGRSAAIVTSSAYKDAEAELLRTIEHNRGALLAAAAIDNVNIRGNRIEAIMTGALTAHRLDDIIFPSAESGRLVVDIKTKLLDRASAPKAYNVDKILKLLADPDLTFAFFFVGLDATHKVAKGRLVSMFDPHILSATKLQHHWAGRASRGVTQLTGDLGRVFDAGYTPSVDVSAAVIFLRSLIER